MEAKENKTTRTRIEREKQKRKNERELKVLEKVETRKKNKERAKKTKAEAATKKAKTRTAVAMDKENTLVTRVPGVWCIECGGKEDDGLQVGCDTCENWLHLSCKSLDPYLSSGDLEVIEFQCQDCRAIAY